jgi:hypothetical protein
MSILEQLEENKEASTKKEFILYRLSFFSRMTSILFLSSEE